MVFFYIASVMHSSELREIFSRSTTVRALAAKLQQLSAGEVLYAEGLSGSSAPAVLSALPSAGGGCCHYLVVMNDADEAGYFYGDLVSMLGDEQVMFFPSPYRRGVKYAQIDATNEILRTDTLSRLASLSEGGQDEGAGSFFIVTYPEALAVKVVTRDSLEQKILTLLNHIPHIVGQAAIGIADIAAPLQHDDFHAFVQSS